MQLAEIHFMHAVWASFSSVTKHCQEFAWVRDNHNAYVFRTDGVKQIMIGQYERMYSRSICTQSMYVANTAVRHIIKEMASSWAPDRGAALDSS